MAQDLQNLYGVGDAEAQLTAILSEQVAAEIDSQILREIMQLGVKNSEDFISVVKCVGYEPTETIYDQFTGKPRKGFKSMNYNDIRNERESNHIWQNYIRPTRIDDKA
jgi:DNA integrity scanning protein DisA with diadenylate cyclase activity